jgi:hypothetical protein
MGRMTRSSARAAARSVEPAAAAPVSVPDGGPEAAASTPVKRGPGRPKGSKNTNPAKGKKKSASSGTRPLASRRAVDPDAEMAGPIPVAGGSAGRSGGFNFPLPVPPIDVDRLHRVFTHDVLVRRYLSTFLSSLTLLQQPFFGGGDFCLVRDVRCDEARHDHACSPCLSHRWPCSNLMSVHQRMRHWNHLAGRFRGLSNESKPSFIPSFYS